MDVIFLAFANSRQNPLPTLQQEANELFRLLSPGELQQRYIIYFDPFATREKIAYYLTQYKDNLVLFHYGGHAGRNMLETEEEVSHAGGLAHMLGQCPRLKGVVLNGCATSGQVKALWDAGVSSVIATHSPVEDYKATQFSIRFYQALSTQENLESAFQLAKGEALTLTPALTVDLHRDFVWSGETMNMAGTHAWGLFVREGKGDVLGWKLPPRAIARDTDAFVPNELLIDTLLETLGPFSEDVNKIVQAEAMGAVKNILDKREAILKSIPHPVSEQLRKLLVDPGPASAGVVFYHELGMDRLRQIINTYDTFLELMAFIMMAQLWEEINERDAIELPEKELETLRQFFQLSPPERNTYNFRHLIASVQRILDANETPYYVEELAQMAPNYEQKGAMFESSHYLEHLKKKLSTESLSEEDAQQICIIAEENLATFLQHLGFIARYTLASVKDIDVLKYRHFKTPMYKHKLVKLVQRFVGLAEDQEIMEQFMDCDSVLLMRGDNSSKKFLNLSPFVIDENAFNEKASIAKLYFFHRYDQQADVFAFKHVYKPNDLPLVINKQKHFLILKAQFNAFSNILFNTPMKAI